MTPTEEQKMATWWRRQFIEILDSQGTKIVILRRQVKQLKKRLDELERQTN